ncbi:AAA domain-containing protein [Streptomyces sp. Ncost-T6T-1]|uniref:AAA family ATPase n=1 Tax=Streptomyces sp. Ncost-T6T-1 TaxID=1100828 RepID=UPI000805EA69|nr:AAA family ATPase [Streptomyces sp. Ncost-T6T-1]SBU96838.1 AAA domain-containing protein [Streptomyces sp. Ncost-T6T-1]
MTGSTDGRERNYSPVQLKGFLAMCAMPPRSRPQLMSKAELDGLSRREKLLDRELRAVWHANIGPIRTPQLRRLHGGLAEVVESNRQDGDKVKPSVVVDAFPGLGKTTAVLDYVKQYHRDQILLHGPTTPEGHRRVPVVNITLTGNITIRGLNEAICRFYELPEKGNADQLAARASRSARAMGTSVIVVDDIHFLDLRRTNHRAVANHFKYLSTVFPVTFIYVGVGVAARGVLTDGLSAEDAELAQASRRMTTLTLPPFEVATDEGRHHWRQLLLTIERQLVLADKHRGMLADDLSDYLYARSTGHFASLMTLISRGCRRAVESGQERLTTDLMDEVNNDVAAERAREELKAALDAGLLTTRPQRVAARGRA